MCHNVSMKKSWYVFGLILGMVLLAILQMPDGKMRIIACDVGQGDAILIIKGNNQVLVDGGPSGEKILSCLERHIPYWDRTIELIVLTHADYDHMNGLASVIDRYELIQFVTADGVHSTRALARLISGLREFSISVDSVEQGDIVRVGDIENGSGIVLDVLWPPDVEEQYVAMYTSEINEEESKRILGASAKRGDMNERSVVMMLEESGYRALLVGDSGIQTEKELVEDGLLGKIDYLKLGHHGSKNSTGLEMLEATSPELAVMSVGKNRYGHPTEEVLTRLEYEGIRVLRTDLEGDVVVEIE